MEKKLVEILLQNTKLYIHLNELEFMHSKSSGPGGQKVNKSNTKVTLNWSVVDSDSVSELEKTQLLQKLTLTNDKKLVISSEKFRSQDRNKQECINKFKKQVSQALYQKPKRKKTKAPKSAHEKRLKEKKSKSEVKQGRKPIKF